MPEIDERELIDRARRGDGAALTELLERVEPLIYRYGMKLCRHPEDARGVLQETMITMARSLEGFRGDASLSTWLYAVARSHCAKKRRKSKFAPEHVASLEGEARAAAEQLPAEEPGPAEEMERRRVREALDVAIRGLDDKYRDVLVLRDIEGLTASQAAEVLEISVPAVKSRLHRARVQLRDAMAPVLGGEEAAPAAGCPDILGAFSQNLEGELTARDCAVMQEHVESCPRCKAACDSLRQTLALCSAVPTPEVPEPIRQSVREAVRNALGKSL